MARFIGLFFTLALSKYLLFQVTGHYRCSSSGIAGCECLFLGACDAHGKPRDNLDLTKHVPLGLELFGHPQYGLNLAYLCEGRTVGILYDCNNRMPLYAATVIRGSQLSGAPGNRPNTGFKLSQSGLDKYFQQSDKDYEKASQRKICFFERRRGKEFVDVSWYIAKNLMSPRYEVCIGGSSDVKTIMHRGHLVASQYGIGEQTLKEATFVYTNAVPQFGDFNSGPWQIAESALVDWCRDNCANNGKQNAQMFIVVGVTPSTILGPSKTRYFGKNGFSDYQDDTNYRVNVPAEMWTAACCTFEFTEDGGRSWQWSVKSTAFWRKNEPGTLPVTPGSVSDLERMLSRSTNSKINLFPYSADECTKSANHVRI
ncbi:uncharacterized protein [Montipora capricornis]|uniref:uncharacterized protein n=1 Tax=Montipora capricornis TaxID=246305 RepID=UPI0035F1929D